MGLRKGAYERLRKRGVSDIHRYRGFLSFSGRERMIDTCMARCRQDDKSKRVDPGPGLMFANCYGWSDQDVFYGSLPCMKRGRRYAGSSIRRSSWMTAEIWSVGEDARFVNLYTYTAA